MKTFDFSKTGGFPLTQNRLDYMQQGYIEALIAILKIAGHNSCILWGCEVSQDGGTLVWTMQPGWIYKDGELVRVALSYLSDGLLGPGVLGITIVRNTVSLPYNTGGSKDTQLEAVGVLDAVPVGGATDQVELSALGKWAELFGSNYRVAGTTIAVATGAGNGTITGNIDYTKDLVANTLRIRGQLSVATPGDFAASPGYTPILLATLAADYRPATVAATFNGRVANGFGRVTDDGGGTWLDMPFVIFTDGKVEAVLVKSAAAYTIAFNVLVPLD